MDLNSEQFRFLGNVAIVIVAFQIVRIVLPWLYQNLLGPALMGPKVDVARMGSWAVVTGATDGIGKCYAKALGRKGLNVVLISRSVTKLEAVAKEIEDESHVKVKIIDVDFTGGPEIFDKIEKGIQSLDIGVLVNNVGISYSHPEFFLNCRDENPTFLRDIISVNIHSVTHMCMLVLPLMVEKKKGVIVNLSSTAAVIPNPLLTVYSATKAFVDKFSVDLQTEYKSHNIIIQSVQPGFVMTNMTRIRQPDYFKPRPETYVDSALKTLGISGQTAGYFAHAQMQFLIKLLSILMGEQFTKDKIMHHLLQLRKRAIKK